MSKNLTRLYCDTDLRKIYKSGVDYALTKEHRHYLKDVMRCTVGDQINLLDGKSGEYQSEITFISKNEVRLRIYSFLKPLVSPADLWLLFSPIKKSRTELIIEKCVELGVKKIFPVKTDYTNIHNLSSDRLRKIMINSAQQCGSTWLPELNNLGVLTEVLTTWNTERLLIFCDEKLEGQPMKEFLISLKSKPIAILVGPEGGFSTKEVHLLNSKSFVRKVSLGPQILRAETAVVAAVSIWQSICGNWARNK